MATYRDEFRRIGGHLTESMSPNPDAGLPDLPDVVEHSCPACDEELHRLYEGRCGKDCRCPCHHDEEWR